MTVRSVASGTRRRTIVILAAILIPVGLLLGGAGWAAWWLLDNIGAPGPGATGSGPCGSGDSVNLQLVYADGHTVQMCTRDRPACPNANINGPGNGSANGSEFTLGNQLRSSSRRYILYVRFNSALPADSAEQTLDLAPGPGFLPGESASATPARATVQITPRDPQEDGFITQSGSITVASSKGVAKGRIDGGFTGGATRSDRPAPSSNTVSPVGIAGTFACTQ